MRKRKPGEKVGAWQLVKYIHAGGNGEVWRARPTKDHSGIPDEIALKILKATSCESEPYARFRIEVNVLRELGSFPGVVPLLDAELPDRPSFERPAWFAMPIATTVKDALGEDPSFDDVVDAIRCIAEALTSLLASKGLSHRDIKPGNLFRYDGKWAIGDFGLVSFPGKEALTLSGKKLGPAYYLAPEMLFKPNISDGSRADVYSLAKTFWVLATGFEYPLPGEQRLDVTQLRLSTYFPQQPRVVLLDQLMERATKTDPYHRPTMAEMAQELRDWQAMPSKPIPPTDLSDLSARIAAASEVGKRETAERNLRMADAQSVMEDCRKRLEPIAIQLKTTGHCDGRVHDLHTILDRCAPRFLSLGEIIWNHGICVVVRNPGKYSIVHWCGMAFQQCADGQLKITAAHIVQTFGLADEQIWADSRIVHLGSASQEVAITALIDFLQGNLRAAVEAFTAKLESPR